MRSELIVMLTHNDLTVENAYEIFEQCQDTKKSRTFSVGKCRVSYCRESMHSQTVTHESCDLKQARLFAGTVDLLRIAALATPSYMMGFDMVPEPNSNIFYIRLPGKSILSR